jgi:hypothetical protein
MKIILTTAMFSSPPGPLAGPQVTARSTSLVKRVQRHWSLAGFAVFVPAAFSAVPVRHGRDPGGRHDMMRA